MEQSSETNQPTNQHQQFHVTSDQIWQWYKYFDLIRTWTLEWDFHYNAIKIDSLLLLGAKLRIVDVWHHKMEICMGEDIKCYKAEMWLFDWGSFYLLL